MKRMIRLVLVSLVATPGVAGANHLVIPTGLAANVSGGDVTLSWNTYAFPLDCPNNQQIQIFRNGAEIHAADAWDVSYVDKGLSANTYMYTIRSRCRIPAVPGVSPATNHVSDHTPAVIAQVVLSVCTGPPTVTAYASLTTLWPPNGKMNRVTVSGVITKGYGCNLPDGVEYVLDDEYEQLSETGYAQVGLTGAFSFELNLEASRLGTDIDGRSYQIKVEATEGGYTGSDTVEVIVPHDQRKK